MRRACDFLGRHSKVLELSCGVFDARLETWLYPEPKSRSARQQNFPVALKLLEVRYWHVPGMFRFVASATGARLSGETNHEAIQ